MRFRPIIAAGLVNAQTAEEQVRSLGLALHSQLAPYPWAKGRYIVSFPKTILFGAALIVTAWGCSSGTPPVKEINETEAAIRAAEEVAAESVPAASLHLKLAQDQLRDAKALVGRGDNEMAREVINRARVDAEVAIAMAHTYEARVKARATADKLDALEKQSTR